VTGSPYAAHVNPSAIALDPSGPYAYVTNKGSTDISAYNVDPSTGALSAISNFGDSFGSTMEAIAVTPSGLYAYSAGYGSGSGVGALDAFTINAGSLLVVTGSPYSVGDTPFGVTVDPSSQFVFVPNRFHAQFRVFAIGSGGTLTPAPLNPFSTGTSPYGVAVYPGGGYVYVTNNGDGTVSAYSYDSFGDLTSLGSAYPVGSSPKGLAMDAGGKFLYVANYGDGTVSAFTINASSGALTSVGSAVATGNLNNVANPAAIDVKVDPSGQYVYVANYLDGSVSLFSVNASTGALTLSNTFAAGTGATAVAVE
jgi:6-phosphogluconolactonase (cycloisomerase 2 family)